MLDPRPTEPAPDTPVAMLLVETPNGPTAPDEATLLTELFGPPNAQGVYGAAAPEGSAQ